VLFNGQPYSQTVVAPNGATFSVSSVGTEPIHYQWYRNGTAIPGATGRVYILQQTSTADDQAQFTVTASNGVNSYTSTPAVLSVVGAPIAPAILSGPTFLNVEVGAPATFWVTTSGSAPMTYQWFENGTAIAGATGPSYTKTSTTSADNNAVIAVSVTNPAGSIMTTPDNPQSPANLVVQPTSHGLGGLQAIYPADVNDLIGVQYSAHVVTNQSQSLRIIFGFNNLYGSNTAILPGYYNIESNIYSGDLSFTDGMCSHNSTVGIYTEAQGSVRNATVDYPFYFGIEPGFTNALDTSDPVNFPTSTTWIDGYTNNYVMNSISQGNINGEDVTITIQRGGTITDVSTFAHCGMSLLPGTYRLWTLTTQIAGQGPVVNRIVALDEGAHYLTTTALDFASEYINQSGIFTVQYWGFAFERESNPVWHGLTQFASAYDYDGQGQDFGSHIVTVGGQDRIEFSNAPGNAYIPGNTRIEMPTSSQYAPANDRRPVSFKSRGQ
jgi:hypothetical protein